MGALQILMKALMELPGTDFMLCMYLIPVTAQKDASIETLKTLADKLESCMFKQVD
jgi:translation initiation factor 3 subunit K